MHSLGSFVAELLFWAGPYGFVIGFVVGAVARVARNVTEVLLSKRVGLGGPRWVLVGVSIGYTTVCLFGLIYQPAR